MLHGSHRDGTTRPQIGPDLIESTVGRDRSGERELGKAWKLLTRELLRVQRVHPARRHRGKRTVSDREVSETRMRKGFKVSTVAEREFGREESLSGRRLGLGLGEEGGHKVDVMDRSVIRVEIESSIEEEKEG